MAEARTQQNPSVKGKFRGGRIGSGRNPNDVIPDLKNNKVVGNWIQQTGKYTFPSDLPPVHMNFFEGEFVMGSAAVNAIKTTKLYRLPVPLQMTNPSRTAFNDGYSYVENALAAASQAAQSSKVGRQVSNAISSAAQGTRVGFNAAGITLNHLRGITLEQPMFKQHSFTWKLSPRTQEESNTITRIIHAMQTAMAPKKYVHAGLILAFPSVFIPYFYPSIDYLYKFKPCVMAALDVDYLGGNEGPSFFAGTRAPESISINMNLIELEYWLDTDYKEDTTPDGLPSNDPFGALRWYTIAQPDAQSTTPQALQTSENAINRILTTVKKFTGNPPGIQ